MPKIPDAERRRQGGKIHQNTRASLKHKTTILSNADLLFLFYLAFPTLGMKISQITEIKQKAVFLRDGLSER